MVHIEAESDAITGITCSYCAGSGEGQHGEGDCGPCRGTGAEIAQLPEDDSDVRYDRWNQEER